MLQDFCLPHGWCAFVRLIGVILQFGQGLGKCNLGDEDDTEPVVDQTVWDVDRFVLLFSAKVPDVDPALLELGVGFMAIPIWQVVDHQEMAVLQVPRDVRFRGVDVQIERRYRLRLEFRGPSRNRPHGRKR